jgi:small-conductance mechanosensitive channel
MATVWKNIMAKISGGVDVLRDRQARLTSQRDAAKAALEKAKAARQFHLLEGDVADTKTAAALQAKVSAAESELAGLDEALTEQARRVADAERQLADEQTKAARKAASEVLEREVEAIEKMTASWLITTRQLSTALAKYETFRFEAGSISKYLANASNEVEFALSVTIPDLRGGVIAVLEGREAPPSQPAPILKIAAPAPPPTKTVFVTRAVKWTSSDGKLHLVQRFTDTALPPELAAHALKVGAAVELNNLLRRQNLGTWSEKQLHAEHCFALDEASRTAAPILHSAFELHPNIGKPFTIKVAPVAMAVGARNMPPTDKE